MNAKQMMEAAVMVGALLVSEASAEDNLSIVLKPNPEKPTEITMSSGNAQLVFYRNIWQAMRLITPDGKDLPVTDLFFYQTGAEGVSGEYWTKPERWDAELSFKVLDRDPSEPRGITILMEGQRSGLKKQVYASMYPGESQVYVVSRLTTDRPAKKVHDIQLSYFHSEPGSKMFVSEISLDGKSCEKDKTASGKLHAFLFCPTADVSFALLCAPRAQQKLKVGRPLIYLPVPKGCEMRIQGIDEHELLPGEAIELRYIIYWSDGQTLDEVTKLSKKLQDRELNSRFYAPASVSNP